MASDADHAGFEEFARSRAAQLYRSAYLLCGDAHTAEDLVQETLAKVYDRWRRPLGGRIDNPAAYAQTTLTRTFISGRRRRSSGEVPYADLPDAPLADASDGADLRLDLQELLGGLSAVDRAVLVLRYVEDLGVDEVAHHLGITPGAVKNRSMRALARARDRSTT
ncbi:SigE family RNA polymerase sigma factor [Nocardioides lijunqiniae]|uniref:SigE family RNA polymerase sigma factor n=1 Tax=Nocardioides lijunqiniae TaxID=2760832 RepID=UPI001877983A|nr:SigE family RNA polymerase sigma factor [Nocardioides lijunqiniae]